MEKSTSLGLDQVSGLADAYHLLEQLKGSMTFGSDGKAIINDPSVVENIKRYFGDQVEAQRFGIHIHINLVKGCGAAESKEK